jgi:hypothetical protein
VTALPLGPRIELWTAARQFADGRLTVRVARMPGVGGHPGPVVVGAPELRLLGKVHRYRQHVDPVIVADFAQAALEEIVAGLCLTDDCFDERLRAWERIVARLGEVPCVGGDVLRVIGEEVGS